MDDIKISVIIPVFNSSKYFSQCISSVVNQFYNNIEIILVDDGSPDISSSTCDYYSSCNYRIKTIHKKNGGLSSARNAGLKIATGDYVIFIDSDDFWNDKSFLSGIISYVNKNRCDFTVFGYSIFYDGKNETEDILDLSKEYTGDNKTSQLKSLIENHWLQSSACNKFFKRSILQSNDIYFREGVFSEDIDWTARFIIHSNSFGFYNKSVYMYRQNDNSITHNLNSRNMYDLLDDINEVVRLGEEIKQEPYYIYYMNYCSYQYITLINLLSNGYGYESNDDLITKAKQLRWLLKYHINKKTKLVYFFDKLFGFNGMLKILGFYLKRRNRY